MLSKIFKNFYCDYIFIKIKNISPKNKIIFLYFKYYYLLLSLIGLTKKEIWLFGNSYIPDNPYGLLGFQIMLKDYYKYYFIKGINKNPIIFDIGAHIGNFSLSSDIYYKDSFIHAFEPIKITFDILKSNINRLPNIKCNNMAIGDKDMINKMFYSEEEKDRSSFDIGNLINRSSASSQEVKVIKLSSYVEENKINHIDILKIDVEGSELNVIKGSEEILRKVGYIIIEMHSKGNHKNFKEIINTLANHDFFIYRFGKQWINKEGILECFDLIFKRR